MPSLSPLSSLGENWLIGVSTFFPVFGKTTLLTARRRLALCRRPQKQVFFCGESLDLKINCNGKGLTQGYSTYGGSGWTVSVTAWKTVTTLNFERRDRVGLPLGLPLPFVRSPRLKVLQLSICLLLQSGAVALITSYLLIIRVLQGGNLVAYWGKWGSIEIERKKVCRWV